MNGVNDLWYHGVWNNELKHVGNTVAVLTLAIKKTIMKFKT